MFKPNFFCKQRKMTNDIQMIFKQSNKNKYFRTYFKIILNYLIPKINNVKKNNWEKIELLIV